MSNIVFFIILIILIIAIISSKEYYVNNRNNSCDCLEFKPIVKDFNAKESKVITNALNKTNKFTIYAILNIRDYNSQPEWQHLFHAGNYSATQRTPGVWINQGKLHVRGTTQNNFNDGQGCYTIEPSLNKNTNYHLILVYNVNLIDVT